MTTNTTDPRKKLWELIKGTRFGMLTHRHSEGGLHSHPLTTLNKSLDDDMRLYFFVSKRTELGQRIQADGNVNVSYSNPEKDTYVSITGEATVSGDMALKEKHFNAMTKAWFPGGVNDPDLELVQVRIQHAEYWDVKETQVTQLYKMAKAVVTGERPTMGEHRELEAH